MLIGYFNLFFLVIVFTSCSLEDQNFLVEKKDCKEVTNLYENASLKEVLTFENSYDFKWLFDSKVSNCVFDCNTGYSFTGNSCQTSSILDDNFNSNGSYLLTTTYSSLGLSEIGVNDNSEIFNIAVQQSGNPYIVVQKVIDDGVDTSYGTNGYSEGLLLENGGETSSYLYLSSSYIDSDGSIFVAGTTDIGNSSGFLAKFNNDGTIDQNFTDSYSCPTNGGGCIIRNEVSIGSEEIFSFVVDGDYIYYVLTVGASGDQYYQLVKINKNNAQLVTSFANNGVFEFKVADDDYRGKELYFDKDNNHLYVFGDHQANGSNDVKLFIQRINATTGALDTSYANSGTAVIDLPTDEDGQTLTLYNAIFDDNSNAWIVASIYDSSSSLLGWHLGKVKYKTGQIDTSYNNDGYFNLAYFAVSGQPFEVMMFNGVYEKTKKKLYVGGILSNTSGTSTWGFLRFNNDGSIDTDWQNSGVFQIDDQYGGLIDDVTLDKYGRIITSGRHNGDRLIHRFIP